MRHDAVSIVRRCGTLSGRGGFMWRGSNRICIATLSVVGVALMAVAVLLEVLQALTPDRSSYFLAAVYGAGGALAAALLAELFIRVRRRRAG